jgi:L-fuculose-phosphate aldolase
LIEATTFKNDINYKKKQIKEAIMITAMGDVMRRAYEKGWITTRDGNISLRRKGNDIMYITPSGWQKTI